MKIKIAKRDAKAFQYKDFKSISISRIELKDENDYEKSDKYACYSDLLMYLRFKCPISGLLCDSWKSVWFTFRQCMHECFCFRWRKNVPNSAAENVIFSIYTNL